MSKRTGSNGSLGNSSNPRPGQSPFPPSNAIVRQATQRSQRTNGESQQSQPYSSSYSNNFNRDTARYSTGRTDESSRYSQENIDPPERSPSPPLRRKQGENDTRKNWEESIYGMYGDIKTPREPPPLPPPPPQQEQPRRRPQEAEEDEGNNSFDEEVPRRTNPQSQRQRPRYSRPRQSFRTERPEPRRRASRQDPQQNEERGDQNDDGSYRRVHVNIDIGGGGGGGEGRSWSWSTNGRGGPNVNFGTPFTDTGFPFGGRNNNGGRLPVNIPFGGGLPINLPFGL
ncbi:hypothetical protein LX36DRAFT_657935 [Colletotrichum falcatum]|nr:hypothetical protein LX36DRAFT_657935 [Colletotrichum falcatum]